MKIHAIFDLDGVADLESVARMVFCKELFSAGREHPTAKWTMFDGSPGPMYGIVYEGDFDSATADAAVTGAQCFVRTTTFNAEAEKEKVNE